VHAKPGRLDDLMIDSGDRRQVVRHNGRSLRSLLLLAQRETPTSGSASSP
jgi:hypothetical protein